MAGAPGSAAALPATGPAVTARAAVLVDASNGRLLWGRNPLLRLPPASTTKIMTALVALELGRLDDTVEISRRAASTPGSSANLHAGDRYTLAELLKGLLLRSGNDAAVAIAEDIAGSVPAFAGLMNERARHLGLLDTHFTNPHGLTSADHYSSAYDLALMARAALQMPAFAAVVRLPHATLTGLDGAGQAEVRELRNTNRLLLTYGWADGVKTGTTSAAGSCLVASATREGHRLIAVVLNSRDRWGDAVRLLEFGFRHFSFVAVAEPGRPASVLPVSGGVKDYVQLVPGRRLSVAVGLGELPGLRTVVSTAPAAVAPVRKGEVFGSVAALLGDRLLGRVPLVAGTAVPRRPWWQGPLHWLRHVARG